MRQSYQSPIYLDDDLEVLSVDHVLEAQGDAAAHRLGPTLVRHERQGLHRRAFENRETQTTMEMRQHVDAATIPQQLGRRKDSGGSSQHVHLLPCVYMMTVSLVCGPKRRDFAREGAWVSD